MKRSELESILESKGLDKSVIPFFGGGVQVEINEGIASFRSINASALKHVQKQINEGGMISGQVLTYRLDESSDGYKVGDVVHLNSHNHGTTSGSYGDFNIEKLTATQIFVYDHKMKETLKFNRKTKRGIGEADQLKID